MPKKNIILHDTFLYKGWWERLIIMMGKALWADIASWFFDKNSFDLKAEWFKWKQIEVSSSVFKKWLRHIKLKLAFLFNTKFLADYDNVIFSWDSISAVRNCWKNTKKIYYCHTPPRYLYDQKDRYLAKIPFLLRPAFLFVSTIFRVLYEKDIKKMDLILTNSENTKKRIKDFLWLDSEVLYPPAELDKFQFLWQQDYYLSYARLSEIKRVDKIVEAFSHMPDKKLVVIYWKNDPQKEQVFKIWENLSNVEFITLEDNSKLNSYIWNSIATIYIPIDEDFWMSPVESMACWKPVIWVDEWWLKESIIDWETGYLIAPEANIEDIVSAIEKLDKQKSLEMRENCEKRAKDFSFDDFKEKLKNYV